MKTIDDVAITLLKKARKRAYMSDYYKKNKEKLLVREKERYKANRDRNLKYRKEYAERNKEAISKKSKIYRSKNKDKLSKLNAEWNKKNKDKIKKYREINSIKIRLKKEEWYKKNKKKENKRMSDWVKNNPEKNSARVARRNAKLLQACPVWADMSAIENIYREAHKKQKETGIPHHVDHIIPLQGKTVSGLHIAINLRPLPALENIKKKNKFIEELVA